MKNYITSASWQKLEDMLMRTEIGYTVIFDNHCGNVEMIVNINSISVPRLDEGEESGEV